jgi:hypothetical protein
MEVFGLGLKIKEEGAATVEASLKRLALQMTGTVLSIKTITSALNKLVTATSESQFASAQLEAVLKSTGGVAGQTADALKAQASALQGVTTFGDDAIVKMQSLLLTFTKIRGEMFTQAVPAILDMASAMGQDLQSAAIQVGKALNDPILGVTALAKAGVQFSAAQKETIKTLVETNQIAKAQGMILAELEVQFGGASKAARNTLGGALQALGEAWGDLFEISEERSAGIIAAIEGITKTLPKLNDALNISLLTFDVWIGELVKGWSQLELKIAKFNLTMAEFNEKYAFLGMGLFDKSQFSANIKKETERIAALEATLGGIDEVIEERLVKLGRALGGDATQGAAGTRVAPAGAGGGLSDAQLKAKDEFNKAVLALDEQYRADSEKAFNQSMEDLERQDKEYAQALTQMLAQHTSDSAEAFAFQMDKRAQELGEGIRQTFQENIGAALVGGVVAGIEQAVASGSISEGFQALGSMMLAGLGDAMIRFGTASAAFAGFMDSILTSLANLLPGGALASSLAMIAMGAALKGVARGMFGGQRGGSAGSISSIGGAGGGAFASNLPTTQLIFGQTSATTAAGMQPRQATNVTIIGPNDPSAQRAMQELLNKANSRGRIG